MINKQGLNIAQYLRARLLPFTLEKVDNLDSLVGRELQIIHKSFRWRETSFVYKDSFRKRYELIHKDEKEILSSPLDDSMTLRRITRNIYLFSTPKGGMGISYPEECYISAGFRGKIERTINEDYEVRDRFMKENKHKHKHIGDLLYD